MSTSSFSLKDHLFNRPKVNMLAKEIQAVRPSFNTDDFVRCVMAGFPERELKQRIGFIREQLQIFLPQDYKKAVEIILKALPSPCDPELSDDDFGDFIYASYSDFVAHYGCEKAVLDFSLNALAEITQRFSAEFALRPFLIAYPQETLKKLEQWYVHPHYHVRRLVSEGSRPRLPWGKNVDLIWEQCAPLLSQLHADPTRFVQRSVANHLNDWSKTHPQQVVDLLKDWQSQQKQSAESLAFMVKHSLRTLLKTGYPDALRLMGYALEPEISVENLCFSEVVELGGYLELTFDIHSQSSHAAQSLLVDYVLYYRNKKGTLSPKVYKIKQLKLKAGEAVSLSKRMPLQQRSTRKIYAGEHGVALQINGKTLKQHSFLIKEF